MGTQLPLPKGAQSPQFSTHIRCGQMAAWIKMPLGVEVGLGPGNFVLDEDPAPPPQKGGRDPQIFGPCLLRPNGWMDKAGTWHGGRPQPRRLCVRWGPSSLPPKGGAASRPPVNNFRPISIVAKRLHAIKMPLGIELGLSPGDFVLDGDPAPPSPKGHRPPIFGPCLLRPYGCMDQDVTWYGARHRPRRLCVRWGPRCSLPKRGRGEPPNIRPMFIVTKRLDG